MTFTPIATIGSGPVFGIGPSSALPNGGPSISTCRNSHHHHQRHQSSNTSEQSNQSERALPRQPNGNNRCAIIRTASPVVQYFYCWLFRFVPIVVAFLVVNCLVAFLFNHQAALTIVHVTLGVIFFAIITMAIYTLVTFHFYRHFYHPEGLNPASVYEHHRRSGGETGFEMLDDELGECDSCRQERLKRTDVPPPYEAPPEYQQLDVQSLEPRTIVILPNHQSQTSKPSTSSYHNL